MQWNQARALCVLLAMAAAPVHAADANFGVSARVVSSRPAPEAVATLPVPPGAHLLNEHPHGNSYHYAGPPEEAIRFYRMRMPQLGYRLLDAMPEALLWETPDMRIDMRFQEVLGAPAATRIRVSAAHGAS